MRLDPDFVQQLIFGSEGSVRFTQDSPVLPDVWQAYGQAPARSVDLLLAPHIQASAGRVGAAVRARMAESRREQGENGRHEARPARAVYNQFHVVVRCRFDEMVRWILPLTHWWPRHVGDRRESFLKGLHYKKNRRKLAEQLEAAFHGRPESDPAPELLWVANIVGALAWAQERQGDPTIGDHVESGYDGAEQLRAPTFLEIAETVRKLLKECRSSEDGIETSVWSINRNRTVTPSIDRSVPAVKADAGRALFGISCRDLVWAVIDTGIDARHPAFRDLDAWQKADEDARKEWWRFTRVTRTYDFTRVRFLLDPDSLRPDHPDLPDGLRRQLEKHEGDLAEELRDLRDLLEKGRHVNWGLLEPFLRVDHDAEYEDHSVPPDGHGTHVAGILAAADETGKHSGMCPDIRLYDLRVVGDHGDEFSLISALQFVSWLNGHRDYLVVHGTNLSLSIRHEVQSYACGATPVCEEADRLVSSGVVVVASAGNHGHQSFRTLQGRQEGYLTVSITDPGNAQQVLTVGATHRFSPHTYGVSYFSSRGPTGDGRAKPDLVAPGEKIYSADLDGKWRLRDGTSMAAPHVSGAAALLMARHTELMGRSRRVKQILCETATDLGRERYFQGHGMVDALRALQSV